MNLQELFSEFGEIEFIYNKKHYFTACYYTKSLFKKGKVEYWLIGHLDDKEELEKFNDLDSLLNAEIEGRKFKDILDKIEIID